MWDITITFAWTSSTPVAPSHAPAMAAKFSMAGAGLFDQSAHAEAADRLQGAVDDLRVRSERSAAVDSRAAAHEIAHTDAQSARLHRSHETAAANAQLRDVAFVRNAAVDVSDTAPDDSVDDDALLDELADDPELERCVQRVFCM